MLSFPFVQKIKSKSTIWYLFPSIWFVLHTNRQWSIFMASGIKPRLFSHSKLLLEQNISKENFKSFPKLWDDLTFFSAHSVFFSNDLMFKVCNCRKKMLGWESEHLKIQSYLCPQTCDLIRIPLLCSVFSLPN